MSDLKCPGPIYVGNWNFSVIEILRVDWNFHWMSFREFFLVIGGMFWSFYSTCHNRSGLRLQPHCVVRSVIYFPFTGNAGSHATNPWYRTTQSQSFGLVPSGFCSTYVKFWTCSKWISLHILGVLVRHASHHTGYAHRSIRQQACSISNLCPATFSQLHPSEKTFPRAITQCGWIVRVTFGSTGTGKLRFSNPWTLTLSLPVFLVSFSFSAR